jgi:hypothetical protein
VENSEFCAHRLFGALAGLPLQCEVQALDQSFAVEGLVEIANGTSVECARSHPLLLVGGDEDDRRVKSFGAQTALQIEPLWGMFTSTIRQLAWSTYGECKNSSAEAKLRTT